MPDILISNDARYYQLKDGRPIDIEDLVFVQKTVSTSIAFGAFSEDQAQEVSGWTTGSRFTGLKIGLGIGIPVVVIGIVLLLVLLRKRGRSW